ncbi:hypothetical protein T484DRAFT_1742616 [Baffinella frigidus]|nr:hypothetical protein T484DRAFT_1742616 [Cryptophyta sp. CCMP2293]
MTATRRAPPLDCDDAARHVEASWTGVVVGACPRYHALRRPTKPLPITVIHFPPPAGRPASEDARQLSSSSLARTQRMWVGGGASHAATESKPASECTVPSGFPLAHCTAVTALPTLAFQAEMALFADRREFRIYRSEECLSR